MGRALNLDWHKLPVFDEVRVRSEDRSISSFSSQLEVRAIYFYYYILPTIFGVFRPCYLMVLLLYLIFLFGFINYS